jgi:(p)ppGpp synthase/HD superfamily hydrolase
MHHLPPPVVHGYSDPINHALAFAAKHHDQQVRRGTRAPYLTQPANVAIILTRYGQDDSTVIAGILHDVVDDWARDGLAREVFDQRLAEKFGNEVLDLLLGITQRKLDDDGVELSPEERRDDLLERLGSVSSAAHWVCAADKLHGAASLVTDLRRTVDPGTVWARFTGGKDGIVRWYRRVCDRLAAVGFDAPIMRELDGVVRSLEELAQA